MTSYDEAFMTKKWQVKVAINYKDMGVHYLTSLHVSKHEFYAN